MLFIAFIKGSRGIYRPTRVLFGTPTHDRALQHCWNISSYMAQIALVAQLIRLQQESRIPPEVSVEDMTDLLVEQSESTRSVRLRQFELKDFDDVVAKPLLTLMWEVNTSMKMRDVGFEARIFVNAPEASPPCFQHPKIIKRGGGFLPTAS